MGKIIKTHEATVRTLSVDVKTLSISGKQVTLSLFRQFPCEPLIEVPSCSLHGVPWGRVNYFWGDCQADHLHIVWQKGNELRRACVYEQLDWPAGAAGVCEATENLVPLLLLYKGTDIYSASPDMPLVHWTSDKKSVTFVLGQAGELAATYVTCHLPSYQDGNGSWRRPVGLPKESYVPGTSTFVDLARNMVRASFPGNEFKPIFGSHIELPSKWPTEPKAFKQFLMDAFRDYALAGKAMREATARYSARYQELASLDQLFIAV